MCLAQGHNTVTPVKLKPVAPQSRVKHSITEPLRSLEDKENTLLVFSGNGKRGSLSFPLKWWTQGLGFSHSHRHQ